MYKSHELQPYKILIEVRKKSLAEENSRVTKKIQREKIMFLYVY